VYTSCWIGAKEKGQESAEHWQAALPLEQAEPAACAQSGPVPRHHVLLLRVSASPPSALARCLLRLGDGPPPLELRAPLGRLHRVSLLSYELDLPAASKHRQMNYSVSTSTRLQ
jgi:hypothetical protein